ncbi:MAG: 30S ribosomal protein S4 [Candidatus Portnoybacteria bacterium]|nr:30S ribosomal protein S4 [Candidatus Portnoybacteria bacterium]
MDYYKCKKCRRASRKLFLKGERCFTQKCAMIKKPYGPGVHGKKRRAGLSEYGRQLLEKQAIRRTYGVSEKQFKNYILAAMQKKGDKRELLLKSLEKRLDNVIFRLGWAKSRASARQVVGHAHILVNSRRMNIPSYEVKVGDSIEIKKKSRFLAPFKNLEENLKKQVIPARLSLSPDKAGAKVVSDVIIGDEKEIQNLGMVIEFYSR